jgi:hypothetical protein
MPPIEQMEHFQYPIKIPISRLKQSVLNPRSALVQQATTITLPINIHVAT